MNETISDNFVRIAKCKFCGKATDEILLNQRLQEIKEEQAFSNNPCKDCEKRFKTIKFFIGNCGHSGFVDSNKLKEISTKEGWERIKDSKIFKMEKCFACINNQNINEFKQI